MGIVSDRIVERIATHILCPVTHPTRKFADYEIMWRNVVESERPHMAI
jgi:hypothetical protein